MDFHQPVLLEEVIKQLNPAPGKIIIDATLGHGGHTISLLNNGAKVYGIEQDPVNLKIASDRINSLNFGTNFIPIHNNFSQLSSIIKEINKPIHGILFDLGLSSSQLKSSDRGFSFLDPSSLDMRLDPKSTALTGEYIINTYSAEELFNIFSVYAQEPQSRQLAALIVKKRHHHPIKSASVLAELIKNFYSVHHIKTRIHPATKILMALRIVVNQEYKNITKALTASLFLPNATIAVITFHSGEDRIVKNFIKNHLTDIVESLKPIKPGFAEQKRNPLSRSALLRVFKIK